MSLLNKQYRYVSVRFQSSSKSYAYRTEDKSIKHGEVVMVPVAEGDTEEGQRQAGV